MPSNSLVAGCISAIWLSRVMVCTILSHTHKIGPVRARSFYDDMTSRAEGSEHFVENMLAQHGSALATHIAAARLTYNAEKTVIVASTMKLANNIQKKLARKNIIIKVSKRTKDLGIDAGAGARRTTKT